MYVLSVVVISILLVNLLIGYMSQRVTDISETKDTLLKLEKISIIEVSETQCQAQFWVKYTVKCKKTFKANSDLSQVYIEKNRERTI